MGIWTDAATRQFWQAPLCYFRTCPCGGAIVYAGGRSVGLRSWLAERIVPPWTFQPDNVPARPGRDIS
jgi:hypothetical protein